MRVVYATAIAAIIGSVAVYEAYKAGDDVRTHTAHTHTQHTHTQHSTAQHNTHTLSLSPQRPSSFLRPLA